MPSFPKAICKGLRERSAEIAAAYWLHICNSLGDIKNFLVSNCISQTLQWSFTYLGSTQSSLLKTANLLEVTPNTSAHCGMRPLHKCMGEINGTAEYIASAVDLSRSMLICLWKRNRHTHKHIPPENRRFCSWESVLADYCLSMFLGGNDDGGVALGIVTLWY